MRMGWLGVFISLLLTLIPTPAVEDTSAAPHPGLRGGHVASLRQRNLQNHMRAHLWPGLYRERAAHCLRALVHTDNPQVAVALSKDMREIKAPPIIADLQADGLRQKCQMHIRGAGLGV